MALSPYAAASPANAGVWPRRLSKAWPSALIALLLLALGPLAARSAHGAPGHAAAELGVMAIFMAAAWRGLRALRLPRAVAAAFLAGAALRLAYLYVTPFSVREHDAYQHVAYVEYVVTRHAIPPPSAGWAFYHPPFYYVVSAGLWRLLSACGLPRASVMAGLQVESIAFQLGFLVLALLTARRWLDRVPDARLGGRARGRLEALFAVLLCAWPSGIIHSVRVGNDDLFYLFFGAALFFVTRWWQDRRARDLHVAALFAALDTLAKSNGLIVFAVLGLLFAVRVWLDSARPLSARVRLAWPALAMLGVSAGSNVARALLDHGGKGRHLLVGNADQLPHALAVGNGAANYLWFDVKMFVTEPYSSSWVDAAGRQYFWNFALKTSLLGDFQYKGAWLANLAVVMAALLLAILVVVVAGALRRSRGDWLDDLPLPATIAVAIASLAALRMAVPMACSNDFRYVWPLLMPGVYLYVRALARLREGDGAAAAWGEAAGWSFALASASFFAVLAARG